MNTHRDRPWTTREASGATGIPAGTLNYWRHVGDGPTYLKVGRRVFYDPATVWSWMDAHATTGTGDGRGAA